MGRINGHYERIVVDTVQSSENKFVLVSIPAPNAINQKSWDLQKYNVHTFQTTQSIFHNPISEALPFRPSTPLDMSKVNIHHSHCSSLTRFITGLDSSEDIMETPKPVLQQRLSEFISSWYLHLDHKNVRFLWVFVNCVLFLRENTFKRFYISKNTFLMKI